MIGNQGTFDINVEGSFGGGANFDARATAIVTAGSLFADNYANRAGAMMVSSDATVIINGNSVFRNNTATMTDYGRGRWLSHFAWLKTCSPCALACSSWDTDGAQHSQEMHVM